MFEFQEPDERSLVIAPEHVIPTIDQQVQIWLSNVSPSGSQRTKDGYTRTMTHFREFLAEYNLDLDSDEATVATCAETWGARIQLPPVNHMTYPSVLSRARKLKNGELSPVTYNDRLTVVASFYKFATRRRWQRSNPIEMCTRKTVGEQNYARPIPMGKVAEVLAGIDRTTLSGKRDYAILSVFFTCGRRRLEVVNLTWGDIELLSDGTSTLFFSRTKGNKTIKDLLPVEVTACILDYMRAAHGDDLSQLPKEQALWITLHRNGYAAAYKPLEAKGISDAFKKYFGHAQTHSARHSLATYLDQDKKAHMSVIQAQLGHKHRLTTETYLQRDKAVENPYTAELATTLLGASDVTPALQHGGTTLLARIREAILANPDMKDYAIARMLGVSPHTVKKHREKLTSTT